MNCDLVNTSKYFQEKYGLETFGVIIQLTASVIEFGGIMFNNHHQNSNFAFGLYLRGMTATILSLYFAYTYNISLIIKKSYLFKLTIVRNICTALLQTMIFFSLNYLSSQVIFTVRAFGPVAISFMDYLLNKESLSKNKKIGSVIATIGVLITVNSTKLLQIYKGTASSIKEEDSFTKYLCVLALIITMIIWAYGVILIKKLKQVDKLTVSFYYGIQMVVINILIFVYLGGVNKRLVNVTFIQMIIMILLIGIPLGIGHILFIYSTSFSKNPGIITMIMNIQIPMGHVYSVAYLGRQIDYISIAGSALVIFGLYIMLVIQSN